MGKIFALVAGLVVAVLGTVFLQPFIESERVDGQREALETYVAERATNRNTLFDEAEVVQATAENHFRQYYADLTQAEVDTIFYDRFPVFDDGSRRSRDEDFEGRRTPSGHLVYGFGAFLGDTEFSPRERRETVAAYLAVTSVGPGVEALYESLYFNDAGNRLIIFAPNRDDQLEFYRKTAPADFEFTDRMFVEIVQPANNPSGQFACTSLTDLMYRQDQRQLTIGCHLPVRQVGRQIGAFGMTLDVKDYLSDAVFDPSGREAFVVDRDGNIVAHAALFHSDVITAEDVAQVREELRLEEVSAAIVGNGQNQAVIDDPTRNGLAAFVKLGAPGWYLVVREESTGSALMSWLQAGLFGLVGGMLVFFQLMMLPGMTFRRSGEGRDEAADPARS